MAIIASLDFEDQTADSAVTLMTPWSVAGSAPTATTAAAVHGNLGASIDASSFGAIDCGGLNPANPIVADFHFTPRTRAGAPIIAQMSASGASSAQLRWNSDGTLALRDKFTVVASGTTTLTADTTYRIAWRTSNVGTQEMRLYASDGTTPLETLSGTIANTAITEVRVGAVSSSAGTTFDLDTIRVADDWLGPHGQTEQTHTHLYVSGGQLVPLAVTKASAQSAWSPWQGMKLVGAASEGGTGSNAWAALQALDADLATAAGESTPFLVGGHTYSGNNFPSTFSATSASGYPGYGFGCSVLNVKCDWTQLANGGLDSHITGFINSIPAGHTVYLIINHEPENDSNPAGSAVWCTGQARAANLIASIDDPRCEFAIVHMSYTWHSGSGRNPEDWNPVDGGSISMTQAGLDRTIFGPDGYTKIYDTSGTDVKLMGEEFDACFAAAAAWGFTRLAISEHSLNNDAGAPVSVVAPIWENDHLPYLLSKDLVYYAIYNSEGPASGTNSKLDTPEELALMSSFVVDVRVGVRR